MPTVYKTITCPKCGTRLYSALVSAANNARVGVTCPKCKVHYMIEYGRGSSKIRKG